MVRFSLLYSLEQRVESLTQLKDLLQSQLEEEYASNRSLRKENKIISDELLECKEQLIEKISQEGKAVLVTDMNKFLTDTIQRLVYSNISNIRARQEIQDIVENVVKGTISILTDLRCTFKQSEDKPTSSVR